MLFTKRLREGVRRGEITCSVRIWMRPHVVVGKRYRMEAGEIEVDSILPITYADITPAIARASGFKGVIDLLKVAKHGRGENVYLVRFHYVPAADVGVPKRLRRRWALAGKTVAQKARVKPDATIAVINRVPDVVESLGLPKGVAFVKPADAQLVFLFVRTRAQLEARMPPAVAALGPSSAIWVFFRKGSRDAGLDMNRDTVWAMAAQLDLRPLGLLGIDETWSAFRLRRSPVA
jgi:hypothetical protein